MRKRGGKNTAVKSLLHVLDRTSYRGLAKFALAGAVVIPALTWLVIWAMWSVWEATGQTFPTIFAGAIAVGFWPVFILPASEPHSQLTAAIVAALGWFIVLLTGLGLGRWVRVR